ncbi:MAG: hypothetical protein WBG65_00455 [Sulfurimonadaceae bacterium]
MNSFQATVKLLKAILSQNKQGKIYDKDVVATLNIKPSVFASMKKRNRLPYAQMLDFCAASNINANDLFFSEPEALEELHELVHGSDS